MSLRFREGLMLLLMLLTGYLILSLYSYAAKDPSWLNTDIGNVVSNHGGMVGAWFADLLFSLLGFFAWTLPAIIFLNIIWIFRFRYTEWTWKPWVILLRFTGFILVLCSAATLTSLHLNFIDSGLPAGVGGRIGAYLEINFLPVFNVTGSTLILLTSFLTGIILYTEFSWFRLIDNIGRLMLLTMFNISSTTRLGFYRLRLLMSKFRDKCLLIPSRKKSNSIASTTSKSLNTACTQQNDLLSLLSSKEIPVTQKEATIKSSPLITKTAQSSSKRYNDRDRPDVNLLDAAKNSTTGASAEAMAQVSRKLELKLMDFGVEVSVVAVHPGPVITRYEIQPAPGVKASKITNLASDLARSLAVISVRVVEVIPGKSVMGIEIPNDNRKTVFFSELITSTAFQSSNSPLSLALGHDISGQSVVVDLAKMPHLLVAGTTGSGKSVGVNAMLLSMLFKSGPDKVRLIMIDPKMLELSIYEGIPHLLAPVVTDMKEAANSLRWCVAEMERRYKLMAAMGVRNLAGYNRKIEEGIQSGNPLTDPLHEALSEADIAPMLSTLPFIVVVIDEFADMMMIVGKKVEELIARIAQKARAAGIHLILATQRPSVDVITGLIKANVPTRISFQVSSKIDSRTIIDQGGAEQLLGHGDMLYLPPGTSIPIRIHGAFVSDDEVHRVVADWRLRGEPCYVESVLSTNNAAASEGGGIDDDSEQDPLYDEAVAFVTETQKASISSVQRKLKVGYNRAARMIESMEIAGVITTTSLNGNREVIAKPPPKQ